MDGLGGLSTRLMRGYCKRATTNVGLPSLSADLDTFAQTEVAPKPSESWQLTSQKVY